MSSDLSALCHKAGPLSRTLTTHSTNRSPLSVLSDFVNIMSQDTTPSSPWAAARTCALSPDPSVVASLAVPSLSPTCGHDDAFFTVTRVPPGCDSEAEVICEACFAAVRDCDAAARRATSRQVAGTCFLCNGAKPVRVNEDIGIPVCDACIDESRASERAADQRRIVPLDIVPDEVMSGILFIGAKESAANAATLARLGITRVLICCDSLRAYHPPSSLLRYHRLPLADSLAQGLRHYLPTAMAFIAQGAADRYMTLQQRGDDVENQWRLVLTV